ncbi:MAG TPA: hypothetical protein VF597_00360 [Candidatus Saccharimonadales bacterium]|jgi:hypothetical protein
MTDTVGTDPFAGLARKRLPGMHMITAIEGGVPLRDALASFMFMMLHDTYPHDCLIKAERDKMEAERDAAIKSAGSPDGMFMASLFGVVGSTGLTQQEWSYLPDDQVFTLYLLADVSVEQTQRWINTGQEAPFEIPRGPLVERPVWAMIQYATPASPRTHEAREYVQRLRAEIPRDAD